MQGEQVCVVVIFVTGKVADAACLSRFIVRDFVYSEDLIEKQREELAAADTTEKELWVSLAVCNEAVSF